MPVRLTAAVFFVFLAAGAYAQSFFAAPVVEAVFYGRHTPAVFYGGVIGADGGFTVGMSIAYGQSTGGESRFSMMEMQFLARFYILNFTEAEGLFVQLNGGPVVFFADSEIDFPAEVGALSAGLTAGWRFPLGRRFYIEPYVRGGYPYLYGGGLSAGVRF